MKRKLLFIVIDIVIVSLSFLVMAWFKPATVRIVLPAYLTPILIFNVLWVVVSLFCNKYRFPSGITVSKAILNIIVSTSIILSLSLVIIFGIKIEIASRLIVFGTIAMSLSLEVFLVFIYISNRRIKKGYDYPHSIIKATDYQQEPDSSFSDELLEKKEFENVGIEDSIYSNLQNRYLRDNATLFDFILESIEVKKISKIHSHVLKSKTFYNVQNMEPKSLRFFVNLHRINDIIRINRYFIQVNHNLMNYGYFVGCVETASLRKRRIRINYPTGLNSIVYFLDYVVKRVFPKLPITKQLYFFISGGRKRVVSEPETYGRLYSCGFKIVNEKYINNLLFFVAQKVKEPVLGNHPSYGPLCKLSRVGRHGEIIKVYKMRTMYPFSEYLQDYVYERNKLREGGKIDNDYRITTVGRYMRKFWIDELPMLINFLRGELKLVGVRPLSKHYYSLYPKEAQERRVMHKPGLIPPFYVDMPKSFDEIVASEMKYIDAYEKHPFRTDVRYFFKSFYNILIKKARSG